MNYLSCIAVITIAFDPIDQRRRLDGDTGYKWALSRSFESERDAGTLANNADAYLWRAVRCLLVGYNDPAKALLERAHE
jgi:hypothetical protein